MSTLYSNMKIFGLNGSKKYAEDVVCSIDASLSKHTETHHLDGESYLKSDENVRNCDVYVISSLFGDLNHQVNEKILNLLFFVGSLKDASARRITVIVPYFAYARQDRKTKSREPISTKYMAQLFESVGVDRLITFDVHSLAAFQNSFRIPVDNIDSINIFTKYLISNPIDKINSISEISNDLVILSPDNGGITRCSQFQAALEKKLNVEIPLAVFDKRRIDGAVKGSRIIGDVKNKKVLLFDDMIATGSTAAKAIKAVEQEGGELYAFCATHGLFVGEANEYLKNIKNIFVTDSVSTWRLNDENKKKVTIIPTHQLMGDVILRTHFEGGSISKLLEA